MKIKELNFVQIVEQNCTIKMTVDELKQKDSTFDESGFIAKVDNTFVMLHSAIMLGNLERVKHKLNSELIEKFEKKIEQLNKSNYRQMYDELNVKSTTIESILEEDEKYVINVLLVSRYMDYIVDKNTLKFISGINDHRIEKDNYLTFTKKKNSKSESLARKCPGCGANINTNSSGKCVYCGTTYDSVNYDWILEKIETR